MTSITTSEIKILAIQVILMAILSVFVLLYTSSATPTTTPQSSASTQTSVEASDSSWITGIIYIPEGLGALAFISSLVLAPFLFFDAIIAIRFIKDIATQWV